MAGLIAALFGGAKNRPPDQVLPGIGGYDMPRGPVGEGGFPGSTSAAPPVHPQSAEGRRERQLTASGAQDEWATLPTRRRNGTPRQPFARNPRQATDTVQRSSPTLSQNVPGDLNRRNTKYYGGRKAAPGLPVSVQSAHLSGGRKPEAVSLPADRYTYDGVNGGFESYSVDRRMPYRIHARPTGYTGAPSNRGADLSGQRYTMAAEQNLNQGGGGSYGVGRARGPLHRPVRFVQPGPWSANYYDDAPDEGTEAPNRVHRSPVSPKKKNVTKTRKTSRNPANGKDATNSANGGQRTTSRERHSHTGESSQTTEVRRHPASRGRVASHGRR